MPVLTVTPQKFFTLPAASPWRPTATGPKRRLCITAAAAPKAADPWQWPTQGVEAGAAKFLGQALMGRNMPGMLFEKVVVGRPLPGAGLRWYTPKDLDTAEMRALFAACCKPYEFARPSPMPAYFQQAFHLWRSHENVYAAANGEAVMSFSNYNALKDDQKHVDGIAASRALTFERVASVLQDNLRIPACAVMHVVDLGCGTGRPTRLLAAAFQNAHVTGVDASLQAVAWANLRSHPKLRQSELLPDEMVGPHVRFRLGLAERTGLPSNQTDIVQLAFVAHELPLQAREAILGEAMRILAPGGLVAFVDHNQQGSREHAIFYQRKNSMPWLASAYHKWNNIGGEEPFLRAYHETLLTDSLKKSGFEGVVSEPVTAWQCVVVGRKPELVVSRI